MPTYPGRASYGSASFFQVPNILDNTLLSGEVNGLAWAAGETAVYYPTWMTSGTSPSRVQVRTNNVDVFSDPQVTLANASTSPKYVARNGYISYAPHTLNGKTEQLDAADWSASTLTIAANNTTAPDGNVTAEKLTCTAAGSTTYGLALNTQLNVTANQIYTVNCFLKDSTARYVNLSYRNGSTTWFSSVFDLQAGVVTQTNAGGSGTFLNNTMQPVGNGWYRCTVTGFTSVSNSQGTPQVCFTGGTGTPTVGSFALVTFSAGGTEAFFAWGMSTHLGYTAPDYLASANSGTTFKAGIPISWGQGLLSEPAATNLALSNTDFSASWVQTDTTRTSTNNTAPDLSPTATLLTEGSAGTASTKQAITITANATYTTSMYFKLGNTNVIRLGLYETATTTNRVDSYFDLSVGAGLSANNGGTGSGAAGAITPIGGGWYRCTLTGAVGNGATAVTMDFSSATAGGNSTRINGATYQAWGGQAESGAQVTSLISNPNGASAATRAADVVSIATSAFPWTDNAGTAYADVIPITIAAGTHVHWSAFKDVNNYIRGMITGQDPHLQNDVASVVSPDIDLGVAALANTRIQISYSWIANDFGASYNGNAASTNLSGAPTTGYTTLYFGTTGVTSVEMLGYLSRFAITNRKVADGVLPTWRYNHP